MGDNPGGKKEFKRTFRFSRIASTKLKSCPTSRAGEWQKTCVAEQVAPH